MNKLTSIDDGEFSESDLYRQLLFRRKAQPIGLIAILIKYAWWGLILIPALVIQNLFFSMIAMTAVFFVPVLSSLAVLLWFLPTTFYRSIDTGVMTLMFASPLPTSDILSSLRNFYGYHSVKILFPFILIFLIFNLSMLFGLPDNAIEGFSEFLKFALDFDKENHGKTKN